MLPKGEGLERADATLDLPVPSTGKPFDLALAVDEVMRMAAETQVLVMDDMANVPEPVRRSLYLLMTAVGILGVVARSLTREKT